MESASVQMSGVVTPALLVRIISSSFHCIMWEIQYISLFDWLILDLQLCPICNVQLGFEIIIYMFDVTGHAQVLYSLIDFTNVLNLHSMYRVLLCS